MSDLSVAVGRRIKAARGNVGMTQIALARRLGMAQKTVSTWESGEGSFGYERLVLICQTLNVSVSWLLALESYDLGDYQAGFNDGWDECAETVSAALKRPERKDR